MISCESMTGRIIFPKAARSRSPSSMALLKEYTNVDDLRNFRNQEFAHIIQGSLSNIDFQNAIGKVEMAFQALRLPTVKPQDLKNQKTFPTEELQAIPKKVDDLTQEVQEKEDERQVLEDQLQKETPSFCILPPKPSHDIDGREREVSEIAQQLREPKGSSDNNLSCLYISGNPRSGKSQLAGLAAKSYYDDIKEIPGSSSFVMTLNAAIVQIHSWSHMPHLLAIYSVQTIRLWKPSAPRTGK